MAKVVAAQPDRLTPQARALYQELGVSDPDKAIHVRARGAGETPQTAAENANKALEQSAQTLAWIAIADIAVFFAVLLVGFAYVWKRGDLDWVRAMDHERAAPTAREPTAIREQPALSA
jgi:hypothetical protein